ncbi:MAG: glycosyltransferase family 4 protein [Anaerolineae bacterium]
MSRILLLTQVLPWPLDAGPKVRAHYMLRHLAAQHEVTLVSFVRADDKPEYVEHLRGIAAAVHPLPILRSLARNMRAGVKGLATGLPIVIARDEMPAMTTLLDRLAQTTSFDLVHADQLSMAGWGQRAVAAAARAGKRPATLLDEHNAIYHLTERMAAEDSGLRRLIAQREAHAFRRYEKDMVRRYDAVLTVTEEDRGLLLDLFDQPERAALAEKFTVVPICVDPAQTAPVIHSPLSTNDPAPTMLHLGTMFWPPNVAGVLWFAREVLPQIWRQLPNARFVVVGKNPPPEVQALATDPRIIVTGYVADPQPWLAEADAFIVPLHSGGGMRVKILDAWLWGLPIVSTTIGAEGISLHAGETILLADTPHDFADAVQRVLSDSQLNQQLRQAGRRWVEETYAWPVVYRRVDAVYQHLLARSSR